MKTFRWILALLLLTGAAPSRTKTYTSGQIISPSDVTENEDNIFAYLQAGVDVIRASAVVSLSIADGVILNADIASAAAIALSKLASGTSGQVIVADASGVPTYVTMSGDTTIAAGGAVTIGSSAVGSTEITDDQIVNADINSAAAIAYSKLAALTSANILVGNSSNVATVVNPAGDVEFSNAGATTIEDNSVDGTDIQFGSDAQGDVYYYDGTNVVRLGAGTSGQFLKTNGAGANPAWASNVSKSMLSSTGAFTQSATRYGCGSSVDSVEDEAACSLPFAGTIKNLYVKNDTSDSGTIVITLMLNGVADTLTCTVATTDKECNDTSNTVTVVAGDEITFRVVNNRSVTPEQMQITAELDAT